MPFDLPRPARVALGVHYSFLIGAGSLLLTSPTRLLQSALGSVIFFWSLFLVVGGLLSLAGTAARIWVGEFLGLILLGFANGIWGGILVWNGFRADDVSLSTVGYGLALLAWAALLVYRWGEILFRVREAAKAVREVSAKRGRRRRE